MNQLSYKSTLLGQFDHHNATLKASRDTLTKNKTIRKRLAGFIESKFNKKDLRFTDIKPEFADAFHRYLMDELDFSNNSAVTYVWMMGKIFRHAKKQGISVPVDPSEYYSYKKQKKQVRYLSLDQVEAIHSLKLTGEADLVRDLFLYSCYTGMSLEELKTVSYDEIENIDGLYCFKLKRGDSFDNRIVPSLPELMDIENKYQDLRKEEFSRLIFPKVGNTSKGKYLKQIATMAGIPFDVKFETARYTFATTIAVKYKLPLFIIHDVIGYTAIQNTDEYQKLYGIQIQRAFEYYESKDSLLK